MPLWLLILLTCLATYRVTRLVASDQLPLIAAPREAFVWRWGRPQRDYELRRQLTKEQRRESYSGKRTNVVMASIAYLWECEWCLGVWIGAGIVYLTWEWTPLGDQPRWISILTWLTASAVTGVLAQREPH